MSQHIMLGNYKTGSFTNQDQSGFSSADIQKVADQKVTEKIHEF